MNPNRVELDYLIEKQRVFVCIRYTMVAVGGVCASTLTSVAVGSATSVAATAAAVVWSLVDGTPDTPAASTTAAAAATAASSVVTCGTSLLVSSEINTVVDLSGGGGGILAFCSA